MKKVIILISILNLIILTAQAQIIANGNTEFESDFTGWERYTNYWDNPEKTTFINNTSPYLNTQDAQSVGHPTLYNHLFTTVSNLTIGTNYSISFYAKGGSIDCYVGPVINYYSGTYLFVPITTSYTQQTINFTATAESMILALDLYPNMIANVDNFTISGGDGSETIANNNNEFESGFDEWTTQRNYGADPNSNLVINTGPYLNNKSAINSSLPNFFSQLFTDITGLTVNQEYSLSFYAKGDSADVFIGPTSDVYTGTFSYLPASSSFTTHTVNFVATETTMRLLFDFYSNTTTSVDAFSIVETTSPGGVSSNLALWLKADTGTSSSIDNSGISSWNDLSGNNNHVNQANTDQQPTFQSNTTENINNNPVVKFDGTDDIMSDASGILSGLTYNDVNIYIISTVNSIRSSFSFMEECSPSRLSAHIPFGNRFYWDAGNSGGDHRLDTPWGGSTGQPYLWSMLYSNTSGQTVASSNQVIVRDGLNIITDNTASSFTGTNQPFYLGGKDATPTLPWSADIAEILIYTGQITPEEHNKIQSYLAIKYGITLDNAAGNYTSSSGNVLWNTTDNAIYHNDVAGIGRDDNSTLDQQKSSSINSRTIVSIDKGGAFTTDEDFLLWGNDGLGTGLSNKQTNPAYTYKVEQSWKTSTSGNPGTVNVSFIYSNNGNISDYGLLLNSSSPDFESVATTSISASSINGDTITFNGVTLDNNMYFTMGTNYRPFAPGGIFNDLTLWLKADAGTSSSVDDSAIDNWDDQSGDNNNVSQSTTTKQPKFKSNETENINYNPVVQFDGINDVMSDPSGILESATYRDANVYMVSTVNSISSTFSFYEECSPSRFSSHIPWGNQTLYWDAGSAGAFYRISTNWGGVVDQPYLWSLLSSTTLSQTVTNARQAIIRDGLTINTDITAGSFTGTNQSFFLGGRTAVPSNPWSADIAECVIFTGEITDVEHNKIQSYLGIKYGITLDNSAGGEAGDYTSSIDSLLWDASDNPTYHNDVILIGRDDNSVLHQKQSQTNDDSLIVYIDALAPNNTTNGGSINQDNSFLSFGHNNGKQQGILTELPTGIYSRIEREWKVTNTNFDNDFALEFKWQEAGPFDINDIRLLVDDDGDFTDAIVYGVADGLTFLEGSVIVEGINTSHIPLNTTRYITWGSVSINTPLPINLLDFSAQTTNNNTVELLWRTSSETNNDFFTIEKSQDITNWKVIDTLDGAGNSHSIINYSVIDNAPYFGVSYYRIKQTDYDGSYSYSDIKIVNITTSENNITSNQLEIYPNPTTKLITIKNGSRYTNQFKVFNTLGEDVTPYIKQVKTQDTDVTFDLSKLDEGIYFILTNTTVNKIYKQ